jgi:hypothetical protein
MLSIPELNKDIKGLLDKCIDKLFLSARIFLSDADKVFHSRGW